ncbi:hypothetical protein HDV01_002130 [Terramyces sp. JEL0728]|nr:hypothetical protein HDV01_002130 [Terramyces sp. JEL0728]
MASPNVKYKIIILLTSLIPEAVVDGTIIPLFPFMVRFLLPDEPESSVGYHAGLLGSAFYLPLFLMNVVWGGASDKYGRKPILLVGLAACAIVTLILGFSQSFALTWICRFVAGFFGANSTVAKGMIGDIARDQRSRTWGYVFYGSVYGVTQMIGPLLGGLLANPADLYPGVFDKNGLFGRYPYLLTCYIGVALAVVDFFIIKHYLIEKNTYEQVDDIDDLDSFEMELSESFNENSLDEGIRHKRRTLSGTEIELSMEQVQPDEDEESARSAKFIFLSWKTLTPILLYCLIAYVNMSYVTALPLFFSASRDTGGIEMNSRDTAFSFTVSASSKLITQLFFFDKLLFALKTPKAAYQFGMLLLVPMFLMITVLSSLDNFRFVVILAIMVGIGISEALAYLAVMLLITESQIPQNLGLAHGLASTLSALARTFSPAISGLVWELGVGMKMPGLVFILGACISVAGVFAATLHRN